MSAMLRDPHAVGEPRPPVAMRSVACVLATGPDDLDAVRQAAALAPGGRLTLIDAHGRGAEHRTRMTAACGIATAHGLEPEVRAVRAAPDAPTVLMLTAGHDLLVVAAQPRRLRDLPRAAVQQAPVPVLLARPLPEKAQVTDRLLVATDGSPEAQAAMRIADAIAHRHGSTLWSVALDVSDDVPGAIAQAAGVVEATLLLVGSRGLSGVAALASVSARVAERAACSVLVVRPQL